ncbi:MAG: response regulator [Anaerolineae bacterium]|jgi:DNA-binding response OmpR family regulator
MAPKHRVLIVEDNPGTIALLTQIVRRAGHDPVLARGGKEALQCLEGSQVDLILLDLMMRDMDGWTLLDIIRADERFQGLPVCIVSARHPREDPDRVKAYAHKIQAYFVKPFELDELVAKMKEILEMEGTS